MTHSEKFDFAHSMACEMWADRSYRDAFAIALVFINAELAAGRCPYLSFGEELWG